MTLGGDSVECRSEFIVELNRYLLGPSEFPWAHCIQAVSDVTCSAVTANRYLLGPSEFSLGTLHTGCEWHHMFCSHSQSVSLRAFRVSLGTLHTGCEWRHMFCSHSHTARPSCTQQHVWLCNSFCQFPVWQLCYISCCLFQNMDPSLYQLNIDINIVGWGAELWL